jgi:hypothetical protein
MHKVYFIIKIIFKKMKIIFVTLFITLQNILSKITQLDSKSLESFTEASDTYLLAFCHKNINECKNLDQILQKITQNIPIARFDVNEDKIIPELYNILSYPHIVLKNKDETHLYNGPSNAFRLNKFLLDKLEIRIEEVDSLEKLQDRMNSYNMKQSIVVVGDHESTNFNITLLAEVCKSVNINTVFFTKDDDILEKFDINSYEFDLFLVQENMRKKRLYIHILENYLEKESLQNFIYQNIREIYGLVTPLDLNLALSSNPLTTMFVIYENAGDSYLPALNAELKLLAEQYRDMVNIVHGAFKYKHMVAISRYIGLSTADLPAFVVTRKNAYNDDDVEKYVYKVGSNVSREDLIQMFSHPDQTKRVYFAETEQIKLAGDNFVEVLSEPIKQEGQEVLLLICPQSSKKYQRIRERVNAVFEKLYQINNQTVLVDEVDPLLNEISHVSYRSIPTVMLLTNTTNTDKLWDFVIYHGDFSSEDIIQFVLKNSKQNLKAEELPESIKQAEQGKPISQVSKYLFEKIVLSDANKLETKFGLKRMWKGLQLKGSVSKFETFDYFEPEDEDWDNFDLKAVRKTDL